MGTEQMACPGCGKSIEVGVVLCPSCGINIQSGEAFDVKIKRAKARAGTHVERLGMRLALGVAFMLGLLFLGGFLYQRRAEKVFRDKPLEFAGYMWRLTFIDVLAASGKMEEARTVAQQLIEELKARDTAINIEDAPTTRQRKDPSRRSRSVRKAEKALLRNLAAKAQYRLDKLPAQAGPVTAPTASGGNI